MAWVKRNTMPTSVSDRLACTWEMVYLLVRARALFLRPGRHPRTASLHPAGALPDGRRRLPAERGHPEGWGGPLAGSHTGLSSLKARGLVGHPLGKNPGDAWTTAVSNFRGAHFATFPTALVTRPLLATCPERVCRTCGQPWQRPPSRTTRGALQPTCACKRAWRAGLVLDPFFGSGTVGLVAEHHGRDWLGIELDPAFAAIARQRITAARTAPRTTA